MPTWQKSSWLACSMPLHSRQRFDLPPNGPTPKPLSDRLLTRTQPMADEDQVAWIRWRSRHGSGGGVCGPGSPAAVRFRREPL